MTARKALTRTQVILICQMQAGAPILCGCGCGEPLDPVSEGVIDEHVIPRKASELGLEGERDTLENRRFYRKPCAVEKTRADLALIAKGRRQGGETGQRARREKRGHGSIPTRTGGGWPAKGSRKLQSRGFVRKSAGRSDTLAGTEGDSPECTQNDRPVRRT